MGLNLQSIRYHCHLKRKGCCFKRVAMLGRQAFSSEVTPSAFSAAVHRAGLQLDPASAKRILNETQGYSEAFYRWLGAGTVDSFDASDYEGANQFWNMNEALPAEFEARYDFVFDGGALEHVFRYSDALRGSMALSAKGGVFLSATPANSYLGHGFYQLGPDIPFSIFNTRNGYMLGAVHLIEMRHNATFYEVLPPGPARGRPLASTAWPTQLLFWGRRIGDVPLQITSEQPDYEAVWKTGVHVERAGDDPGGWIRRPIRFLPRTQQHDLLRFFKLIYSVLRGNGLFNPNSFRPSKEF